MLKILTPLCVKMKYVNRKVTKDNYGGYAKSHEMKPEPYVVLSPLKTDST